MIMRRLSQGFMAVAFISVTALAWPAFAAPGVQICDSASPPNCTTVTNNKLDVNATATLATGAATSAKQDTGNTSIGNIDTKTPVLGAAAQAASTPVVLPTDPDYRPASGTITTQDIGSATASGQNSSSVITGTPTANSFQTFPINGMSSVGVLVSGTWTGTLEFDLSYDGGTTYTSVTMRVRGVANTGSTVTANANLSGDVSAATHFRVRATAAMTGTATVKAVFSATSGPVQILNPVSVRGIDGQTTASASNLLPTGPDGVTDGVTTTASVTSATTVLTFTSAQLQGMGYITFGFSAVGIGGTIVIDVAADGTNFNAAGIFWRIDSGAALVTGSASSPGTNQQFVVPVQGQTMRIRLSAYTSGTYTVYATVKRGSAPPTNTVTVTASITGNVASAATDSGNPVKIGCKYNAAQPAFTDAQRGDCQIASNGALIEKPFAAYVNTWNYAAASGGISNSTAGVTVKTADATRRICLTSVQLSSDALGAATEVVFRDGASSTVVWRGKLTTAGVGPSSFNLSIPVCGTANTLMEVATLTATITGGVYVNAQGYVSP